MAQRQGPVVVRAHAANLAGARVPEERRQDADEARVGDEIASPGYDVDDVRGHGRDGHPSASSGEVFPVAATVPAEAGDNQPEGSPSYLRLQGTGCAHPESHDGSGQDGPDAVSGMAGRGRDSSQSKVGLPAVVSREADGRALQATSHILHLGSRGDSGGDQQCGRPGSSASIPLHQAHDGAGIQRSFTLRDGSLPPGELGDAGPPGLAFADGLCLLESGGVTHSPGQGTAIQVGQGARNLVCQPVVRGLADSQTSLDELRAAGREVTREPGGGDEVGLDPPVRVTVRPRLQAPQGCLQNPHNLCYLNSASQAFAWMGQLTGQEDSCYGSATFAVRPVLNTGKPLLPQCMPWHLLLRGWQGLAQQNDVCQFILHLLDKANPRAYQGRWDARLM